MEQFEIKKILIAVDFSPACLKVISPAVLMAKQTNAEIVLVHVIEFLHSVAPPFYFSVQERPVYENDIINQSKQELDKLALTIKQEGVEKVSTISVAGKPYKEIIRLSLQIEADIIIMGTHGISGFNEFFVGSNALRVVGKAECPVLTIQDYITASDFKNILVPFRDKAHSREKVMHAIAIAKIYGATLHILGVDTEGTSEDLKKITLEGEQIKKIVERYGVNCVLKVISGPYHPGHILKYAKKINSDIITVTSDKDAEGITGYFLGSFAHQVISLSHIPVLCVNHSEDYFSIDIPGFGI